jgi:murein DD-endopeptidase MepM/ murein hydrolase activator NlpD
MSKILVMDNRKVNKGEAIGLIGETGRATDPHLHLGVQWYKERIDPMILFNINLPSKEGI